MPSTKERIPPDAGIDPSYLELPLHPEKPAGRVKNVVFDWYGTIYNCTPLVPEVFSDEMYRRFQVPKELAYRNFRSNKGLSIGEQIEDLLGTERYDSYDPTVIQAVEAALYNRLDNLESDIFPDVPGGLFKLLRKGYSIDLLSHNKESSLRTQVQKKGLTGFFKFIVGRDSCEDCSDKGNGYSYLAQLRGIPYGQFIQETVSVVDTAIDVKRSYLSGIPIIARAGFESPYRNSLYGSRANWVVENLLDLDAIIPLI